MDTPTNHPVRFGVFELDTRAGELRRSGRRVALAPQPLEILRALIERPGELVTREELRRRIWTNGAYLDFDRSLNKAIVKLRDALGDDADSPRYIETLPRHGYRFIPLPQVHAHVDAAPQAQGALTGSMSQAEVPASSNLPPASRVQSAGTRHGWRWVALGLTPLALSVWLVGSWFRVEAPSQSGLPANVAPTKAAAFAPPEHSIAVLPFVNLSGDKEQEYFADGLTEELLNSLTHIDGLQVAARTSSFSFREHPDVADVAHKLNVGAVLEGSVRRSGHTVRVTAQLVNAGTGFHLWSKTYDRDLGDVLKLQTEIATAVAGALKITLLGDVAEKIELGGTRSPAAFDAYLRASKRHELGHDPKDYEAAIAGYSEAIRLDPDYALAFAYRSLMWNRGDERALADARQAIALAPELAEGHLALAMFFQSRLDFANAKAELERAITLAPGNATALRMYGQFAVMTGHTDAGISAARRAVRLDPLNPISHYELWGSLYYARRYAESVAAASYVLALNPPEPDSPGLRGLAYYSLGDFQNSRASCEAGRPDNDSTQTCLALTYHRLGRYTDAEAQLTKLEAAGARWAYECARIYAQWGNRPQALEYLEWALRLHNPDLRRLKADPLMDPLRDEPRFQAIEWALKFPN